VFSVGIVVMQIVPVPGTLSRKKYGSLALVEIVVVQIVPEHEPAADFLQRPLPQARIGAFGK
jgi:hypothetical protein